jgi:hypothetical protein
MKKYIVDRVTVISHYGRPKIDFKGAIQDSALLFTGVVFWAWVFSKCYSDQIMILAVAVFALWIAYMVNRIA